jgi:hypothetical protein
MRTKPDENISFPSLERKLLAVGGKQVVVVHEPHLDILLERGRAFPSKGKKKVRGEDSRCHLNALLYYATHHTFGFGGTCEAVRGYGLSRDGLWRQHSWVWDGERVIETTDSRTAYFGVILTPLEACNFFFSQVFMALPGWPDLSTAMNQRRGAA